MKIIHFPGSDRQVQNSITDDYAAIRQFALDIATKIRSDPDLNHVSPVLIDKIVMMLVRESRHKNGDPVNR